MIGFSRRSLARYAVDQLLDKQPPKTISLHLAAVLVVSKKTKDADLLMDDIAYELEVRGLLVKAQITSVRELSRQLKTDIAARLKKATKVKEVSLIEKPDKAVIGGIRIETAQHVW